MTTLPAQIDARFRVAATGAGLLDVAYDVADSPLGPLFLAATGRGLCRIAYDAEPEAEAPSADIIVHPAAEPVLEPAIAVAATLAAERAPRPVPERPARTRCSSASAAGRCSH